MKGKGDAGIIVIHGDVETQADTVNSFVAVSRRGRRLKRSGRLRLRDCASLAMAGRGGTFGFQSTYTEYGLGASSRHRGDFGKSMVQKFDISLLGGRGDGSDGPLTRSDFVRKVVTTEAKRTVAVQGAEKEPSEAFSSSDFPIYRKKYGGGPGFEDR